MKLLEVSAEMDFFVRCNVEDGDQRRLALMISEVRRCPKVLNVVSPDLLALSKDFGHSYYGANRSYWAREFYFESHVR